MIKVKVIVTVDGSLEDEIEFDDVNIVRREGGVVCIHRDVMKECALKPRRFTPMDCPHCEHDRQFPETASGGWIYTGNNGPYVPCPDGERKREDAA